MNAIKVNPYNFNLKFIGFYLLGDFGFYEGADDF